MAKIHFILQGKGGVGKSMIASMLYQGLTELCREDGCGLSAKMRIWCRQVENI